MPAMTGHPRLFALLGAMACALALVPSAAAQAHEHADATGVVIAHDVPPSGRTYVGDLNHFAILDLGLVGGQVDTVPDFHQQNHARVTWNGLVLYETTPDSGHDYDGIHAFDVAFPGPGPYMVEALAEDGKTQAMFMGTVVEPKAGSGARLLLDGPDGVDALQPATFTFHTDSLSGILVDHSDATFEVRQGAQVVFRTKTHTHEEQQKVEYAFPAPGTYTVRVVAFLSSPSGKERNDFHPVVAEKTVEVGVPMAVRGQNVPGSVDGGSASAPPADQNAVVMGTATGGDLQLIGTYDPYTQVGPGTLQHLTALVMDPVQKAPVQHVDFEATLTGPAGQVFHSDTLHEYDGLYELAASQPEPGVYTLSVSAEHDAWKGSLRMAYVVVPPVVPVALDVPPAPPALAGISVELAGADGARSGTPLDLTLAAHGLGGQVAPHSEVDVQLLDAAGVPLLVTKLHTHSDGLFPFRVTLPAAGDYTLRLTPFPLDPQASASAYATALQGAVDIPIHAEPGTPLPVAAAQQGPAQDAPAAPVALLLAGLALLAWRRR